MKLSIVTINYNNRQGLANTIRSVEAQTVKDFEWVVVDGGSADGSRELIQSHTDSFSSWVSEPDKGIYNAMNKGIRMSNGEYLLFLNSGDRLFDNNVIARVLPLLYDEDYIVGRLYLSDQPDVAAFDEKNLDPDSLAFMLTISSLPHQSTFIKKSVFDKYGFYREDLKIVSDWDLVVKSIILGSSSFKPISEDVCIYDTGGISSVNKQLYNHERSRIMAERGFFSLYFNFYRDYYDYIQFVRNNKFMFFLMRLSHFFIRKKKA